MKLRLLIFASFAMISSAMAQDDDSAAVRRALTDIYDKPEARISVDAVVVEDGVAIADWSQGDLAGRALLRRKGGVWGIALCAGDALRQKASLERLGMSPMQAGSLAERLAAAERSLSPATLARMAQFDGIVAVEPAGAPGMDPHHRKIP